MSEPETEAHNEHKGGARRALMAPLRLLYALYRWVMGWADRPGGSVALGAISFAEASFFPIPPDPLLGAMCLGRRKRSFLFATITTFSSVAGGVFGWILGMYLFSDVVVWGIEAVGGEERWFGVAAEGTDEALLVGQHKLYQGGYLYKAHVLFNEWGFLALFAAAVSPIPYKVATVASGLFALPLHVVILGSILGRGLRFYSIGALLFFFGDVAKRFIDKHFAVLTVLLVILAALGFYVLKFIV